MTEKEVLQLALNALEASEKYIVGLRQRVYSSLEEYMTQDHLRKLDTLSQIEWPMREKAIAEIKKLLATK